MGDKFTDFFSPLTNLFKPQSKDIPKQQILDEADEAGEEAAEAERRRRAQTETKRSGSVGSALSAAIGKTTLGGS